MMPPKHGSDVTTKIVNKNKRFIRYFWGTIIALIFVTIALFAVGLWRTTNPDTSKPLVSPSKRETSLEINRSILGKMVYDAAASAELEVSARIEAEVDAIFLPIYAGIPRYTDFHYSVIGEYTELLEAATGAEATSLISSMYAGLDERVESLSDELDAAYLSNFLGNLDINLRNAIPEEQRKFQIGETTRGIVQDAVQRAFLTIPVASVLSAAGSIAMIKSMPAVFSGAIGATIAKKAAAKGLIKGTGFLSGASSGALVGSFLGPVGTAFGGVVGGVAVWLLVDATVVNLDEFLNRDEFERDLRLIIDNQKLLISEELKQALTRKTESISDFTLSDVFNKQNSGEKSDP